MESFLKDSDVNDIFKDIMFNGNSDNFISESLTNTDKSDIKSMVKKEIKDFLNLTRSSDLDKRVEDIIRKRFKNDKDIEKYIVEITKNVLVQMYKNLWTKRSFWSQDLKNSPV